ncbi:hypothetical protein BC829DRAFT_112243 [Chytridium lagenaria]|nr:hypothetical protein BC829DRAFT_112243 [Chytridium lagenaria]
MKRLMKRTQTQIHPWYFNVAAFLQKKKVTLYLTTKVRGGKGMLIKNLPAFRLLLQKFPKADWYVMIDDDTYLFVENLRAMLEKMDPSHPWYLGSANVFMGCDGVKRFGDGPMFAHGGSGIVMSRAALHIMVENIDACIWKYRDCWAGDVRTALCLRDLDIYVTNTPGFWGSSPSPKTSWPSKPCERPNTFHHLKPSKIQLLYNIETSIRKTRPAHPYVTTADVYRAIMARNETSTLEIDVDRPGYDMRSLRTASAVDCKIACQADEMCMAFTFSWGGMWRLWVGTVG